MFSRFIDNDNSPVVLRNVDRLAWGRLVSNACYRFAPPFVAVIARGLDVTVGQLGIALMIGEFAGLLSPVIGRRIDRSNRLAGMTFGMSALFVSVIGAAVAPNIVVFTVSMFVLSASKVVFDTALIVNGTTAPSATVDLGAGRTVLGLSARNLDTCALLDGDELKCWGYNEGSGTLGLGDMENHGDGPNEMGTHLPFLSVGGGRTVKSIVAGSDHTCALLDNNTVKCWGWNLQGQLGYGDKEHRGDNESIDGVPSVNLGVRVRTFSSYQWHSCAILENRSVECWGWNGEGYGQRGGLGLGDFLNRADNPDEMGNNLPAVNLGTGRTAKALSVGPAYAHTCAILDNNTLKCWGWNGEGQLGLGDDVNRGDTADAGREMGDLLATVNLGAGRTARAVASGEAHTCALLDNGSVKCWGLNGYGQLGIGDNAGLKNKIGDQPGEMGDALPAVNLGVRVKSMVNEPTAASVYYARTHPGVDRTILVFDLGGGTFDVSVLEIGDGVFEVKSTHGDTHLGGDDWDQRVIDWLVKEFKAKHGVDLGADKTASGMDEPGPNPALGLRAIRYCLAEPHIFHAQLRAILRASHYGRIQALAGIDLEVKEGELVALVGANGAGKTTTLRILLGLARADDGSGRDHGGRPWSALRSST